VTAPTDRACPFCGATATRRVADFATSLMVAAYRCDHCNSYFEAIKWGERSVPLDVPPFLDDAGPATG